MWVCIGSLFLMQPRFFEYGYQQVQIRIIVALLDVVVFPLLSMFPLLPNIRHGHNWRYYRYFRRNSWSRRPRSSLAAKKREVKRWFFITNLLTDCMEVGHSRSDRILRGSYRMMNSTPDRLDTTASAPDSRTISPTACTFKCAWRFWVAGFEPTLMVLAPEK